MTIEVPTAYGPATLDVDHPAAAPLSLLVLGHSAGGGVDAPDLVAVRDAAVAAGVTVVRTTQPYRVAGRRAPAPARQLDEAFTTLVAAAREHVPAGTPLVVGGRSSGARVACRTAVDVGAVAVVALVFPLHPPGRPERSRAGELPSAIPTLVIAGEVDPFGVPSPAGPVEVRVRPGEGHDLRRNPGGAAAEVVVWLAARGLAASPPPLT